MNFFYKKMTMIVALSAALSFSVFASQPGQYWRAPHGTKIPGVVGSNKPSGAPIPVFSTREKAVSYMKSQSKKVKGYSKTHKIIQKELPVYEVVKKKAVAKEVGGLGPLVPNVPDPLLSPKEGLLGH